MSFTCQKCRQPLLLAPSVSSELDLTHSAYDLVQDSFLAHRPVASSSASASGDEGTWSARLRASSRLFDLLSHPAALRNRSTTTAAGTTDHPLCKECTDALLELMDGEMAAVRGERDALLAFEAECRRYGVGAEEGGAAYGQAEEVEVGLRKEVAALEEEERCAWGELEEAEARRRAMEREVGALEEEERALRDEEERFWTSHAAQALELAAVTTQRSALETSLRHTRASLARLARVNVYDDAFCIGHDGAFATINGLRLGRLPGAAVEWAEINAAWGHTALLLCTLARRLHVRFAGWRIVPKGSFTTVHRTDGEARASYELFGSGEWQLGRLLQSRRFDQAMVGFLECLAQLARWAEERDEALRLPHAIYRDRIGEASVRLQFGQDETWTRALRHVLWTLKVLLSWTVARLDAGEGEVEGGGKNKRLTTAGETGTAA